MKLSFVPSASTEAANVVRVVRVAQNTEREPTANDETLTGQGLQPLVRVVRVVRVENSNVCKNTGDSTREPGPPPRNVLQFRLDSSKGGNAGGTVIADDDLTSLVLELVARYGQRLDLDDLTERVRERFAIVAESAPDAEALRVALAEAEAVILRTMTR
ncbi:hypothetical protein [Crenobacter caeni]|uniref:Uncharacterized protein n=1 Tax=Crenobacter caeni TaxID=2705474 RepID=A0A6B2KQW7_9NEIS|nr:hypothetical protein [Crenobacter caeni]NDV12483.1 hypothetical protein [Crenobacter caeni]